MLVTRRISIVFSLAAYLLASTAIHLLHDHSDCGDGLRCHAAHCHAVASASQAACDDCSHAEQHPSPSHCEDSCFACQFLAVKAIPAELVELAERTEKVQQIVPPEPVWVSVDGPSLPPSRAPPCA